MITLPPAIFMYTVTYGGYTVAMCQEVVLYLSSQLIVTTKYGMLCKC